MLVVIFLSTQAAHSQITIGSKLAPHTDALLDLKQDGVTNKGLLLPRVALESTGSYEPMSDHTKGMVVYNTATINDVSPGFYYNDGDKWKKLFTAEDSFFYMPSTVLPTDDTDPSYAGGTFTINLHNIYQKQFGLSELNAAKSHAASTLPVYANNQLYYFITYYDDAVFSDVQVSNTGVLTYKLKNGFTLSEKTFMNIVFKAK